MIFSARITFLTKVLEIIWNPRMVDMEPSVLQDIQVGNHLFAYFMNGSRFHWR